MKNCIGNIEYGISMDGDGFFINLFRIFLFKYFIYLKVNIIISIVMYLFVMQSIRKYKKLYNLY